MTETYIIVTLPERTRYLAGIYPALFYSTDRADALRYHHRQAALDISRDLRKQGHNVIATRLEEEESIECVGGLKALLLPAPTPMSTAQAGPFSSMGPTQPVQDDIPGAETLSVEGTAEHHGNDKQTVPQDSATTNTLYTPHATREAITQAFIRVMGLE